MLSIPYFALPLVSSGLKAKLLEMYKRLVLQSYGYQHLLTFENMEKEIQALPDKHQFSSNFSKNMPYKGLSQVNLNDQAY